jgi:hypothetical protein
MPQGPNFLAQVPDRAHQFVLDLQLATLLPARHLSRKKMAANEAVASESTASPSNTTTTANTRDVGVLGTTATSP